MTDRQTLPEIEEVTTPIADGLREAHSRLWGVYYDPRADGLLALTYLTAVAMLLLQAWTHLVIPLGMVALIGAANVRREQRWRREENRLEVLKEEESELGMAAQYRKQRNQR